MGTHPIFESDFDCLTELMIEAEDISTEEFSDVSQDRESELAAKKEVEKIEQIQEYKNKLERLERDELDELRKKWKRLESKANQEKKTLTVFKSFLLESIRDEYTTELKEADSELEGKRDELRSKLLLDLEDMKKALEAERNQSDILGNVIDSFEAKAHFTRRLRDRKPNADNAAEAASLPMPSVLPWLKRQLPANPSLIDPVRRKLPRLGPGLVHLLSEQEIQDDLRTIKSHTRKRTLVSQNKEIVCRDGKIKIGQKWFYQHEPIIVQHRDGQREHVKLVGITETAIEVKKENAQRIRISMGKISRGKVKLLKQ